MKSVGVNKFRLTQLSEHNKGDIQRTRRTELENWKATGNIALETDFAPPERLISEDLCLQDGGCIGGKRKYTHENVPGGFLFADSGMS
ncbi:hypothetical protein Zmor_025651 [Zophobas morio]|uniref:Uncharacterized protein n=1 Tax=Zophobas morio TaxID=2755281 RepID=A0AA38HRZ9_9CUCU|nr:hypothetical protein Zmor_025651 [Zophobas morio]